MFPWVCTMIENSRCQNVVSTSVTNSAASRVPRFVINVMCDLLVTRRTAAWNLTAK